MKIQLASAAFAACLAATGAFASMNDATKGADDRVDIEGAFKVPPASMFSTTDAALNVDEVTTDEVAVTDEDTAPVAEDVITPSTRCGFRVQATSVNAVGDPCATTADVMASLNLSRKQIAYVDAHSGLNGRAVAH